jgi:TP901 family phage tail tape measure protein
MAASVGDALLNIVVDPAQINRTVLGALGGNNFSSEAQKIGKALGTDIGKGAESGLSGFQKLGAGVSALGLVVAGVSLKMALDFESSLTSIKALTNSSAQDISQYRGAILSLSGEVAQSPKQLAEALYFVASAGFTGKAAIDVLTVSAKAAAAGLADTKVVADAVTSAVNAYGQANLTAKQATDVLVATVNEGKAEFADIAGAIGQVVGVAAAAGVSFNEVGAAMAGLTDVGISADEAATTIKSTLIALEAPSTKVKDILGQLGLTADDLRKSVREKGLISTIQDLSERLHGQVGPLLELIPNHRTLALVLGATGQQAGQYNTILDHLNHASDGAGATAKAFAERQKDVKFQLDQTIASAQAIAVSFGERLIPVLRGALSAFRDTVGFLDQNKVAAYALAVIVGGPLVAAMAAWVVAEAAVIGGKLLSFWSSVADVAVGLVARLLGLDAALSTIGQTEGIVGLRTAAMGGQMSALAGGLGVVGAAVALLTFTMAQGSDGAAHLRSALASISDDEILQKFHDLDNLSKQGLGFKALAQTLTGQTQSHLSEEFKKLAEESPGTAQRVVDAMKRSGESTSEYEKILAGVSKGHQQAAKDAQSSAQIQAGAAKGAGDAEKKVISDATQAQQAHQAAIDGVISSLKGIGGAAVSAGTILTNGTQASDDELKKLASSLDKVQDAYRLLPTTAGEALAALGVEGKLTADQIGAIATQAKQLRDGIASSFGSATSIVGNFASQIGADPAKAKLDAKQATLDQTEALHRQAEAQAKLNDLQSGKTKVNDPADLARQIAAAQDDVARTALEVERTSDAAAKSQDSLGISINSINKFFADQVKAARDWSTNLQALVKAGVDHGLVAELAQAGPKSAPLVAGLLADVKAGNLGVINKAQTDLQTILTQTQGAILGYETPFYIAGQTDGQGLTSGLGVGVAGATAALNEALQRAVDAARIVDYFNGLGKAAGTLFAGGLQEAINQGVVTSFTGTGGGKVSLGAVIHQHAAGGFTDRPQLSWLSEGYKRELVLPLTDIGRSMDLLGQSGLLDQINNRNGGSTGPTSISKDSNFAFYGDVVANDPEQLISEVEHRARLKALSGE